MSKFTVFGKSVPRVDAWAKVSGETKYLDDIKLDGMLYGKILRSPHPHARVLGIDISKAKKLAGVRAVITAKDTPKIKFSFVQDLADKLPLCDKEVCYVGDEVSAVVADSLEIAEEAIDLIEVKYEVLPSVFDPKEAIKPSSVLVHEDNNKSNIAFEIHKKFGDVEKGFKESDYVFEDEFVTSKVTHCCLETHGCIAYFNYTGKLTIYCPSQAPHTIRQEIARILNIPRSKVRIVSTPAGGAFGQRLVTDMKQPIAAILSRITRRPVKIVNTREEEFMTARTRYPYIISVKTGVTKEGKILARQVKVVVDNGAYNDKGISTLNYAGECFLMSYNIPNLQYDGFGVYTNKQFGTAFRGFGNPQVTYATETQIDDIASKLNMNPMELRLMNINKLGDVTVSGTKIISSGLADCINQAVEKSGWREKRNGPRKVGENKYRGIGMAIMSHTGSGGRFYGYAATDTFLKVSEEGQVTVITPAPDIGQGTTTVVAQIVAEVIGVDLSNIIVINSDTDIIPYDLGAWGSRSVFVCGNAAKAAAENLKKEIIEVVSKMFEASPEEVEIKNGEAFLKENHGRRVSFGKVAEFSVNRLGHPLSGRGRYFDPLASEVNYYKQAGKQIPTFTYGCQIVEVEVDTLTGEIKVIKITAAQDTGKTANPHMAEGQMEGAILQGLGYAFSEECLLDKGRPINPNFTDYKIWTALDIPDEEIIFVETDDPLGPFGAKGIGEPGLVPTPAAISNAIYHATDIRLKRLPMNSERMFYALKKKR